MGKRTITISLSLVLLLLGGRAMAQELEVHKGFVFYAGKYTMDEETFGLYEEGHSFENLLKEVPAALDAFHSFEAWHTTGNVFTGLGLAGAVVGGILFAPIFKDDLPSNTGLYGVIGGGGLIVLGVVFEMISWSKIGTAAELYNKDMEVDDGPALNFDPLPLPTLAVLGDGAHLSLAWRF